MQDRFDIIIVGAGSAGCVLANRLSRDPSKRVLLLEAGGWDRNPLISIPTCMKLLAQLGWHLWGDVSEPDPALNDRRHLIPHGRVVGGSSSLNYMAVVRGEPAAYDEWEAMGAKGWGFDGVVSHFRACERWGGGESQWRGAFGEVQIIQPAHDDPLHDAYEKAVKTLGHKVLDDYNSPYDPEGGFGPVQYNVTNGRRASSGRAFLRPALKRPNLVVRTGAHATRIIFEGKKAVGIEYQRKGRRESVYASERVVLSLGAINTPHLLMLSGVGPAKELAAHDIPLIADLPVGQNMSDHIGFEVGWNRKSPGLIHGKLRLDRLGLSMIRAYTTGKGFASAPPPAHLGFVKSRPDKKRPDLEIILTGFPASANYWFPGVKRAYTDGINIRVWLLNQQSRGRIELASADPFARPRVRYNSLTHPDDIVGLREAYRKGWAIGESAELAPFRADAVLPPHELRSDAEVDAFIRQNAMQLYHPSCTCPMGTGEQAVLNSDMDVKGIENLFVVDLSAMPTLSSGAPNIVSMMMADKAASIWQGADDR